MTRLVVCAALSLEVWAVGSRGDAANGFDVLRTGMGPRRARAALGRLPVFDALAVVGFGGSLVPGPRPGDLLVATEVRMGGRSLPCRGADVLAALLRDAGLTVHRGPLLTTDHLVTGPERRTLSAYGATAVDMESGVLAEAAGDRPFAAVRAIVDTPDRPLSRPATVPGGLRALRGLRACGPALRRWPARLDAGLPSDRPKEVRP